MDKVRLLLVEDEPIIAADLEIALRNMGYDVIETLDNGEEVLEFLQKDIPDLILMDIQLEGDLDGIDTAHQISKDHQIPIIFLTSNTDQATFNRAKLTQPHGFLSKPFRLTDIKYSIDLLFLDREEPETKEKETASRPYLLNGSIFVKSRDHLVKVRLNDILYVEADSSYCTIVTEKGKEVIVSTLKKFASTVKEDHLVRIHKSYIINLDKIEKIGESYVVINDQSIPIGRSYRDVLFSKIKRY